MTDGEAGPIRGLDEGEAHLWWVRPDEVDPARLDQGRDLLTTAELERVGRFRRAADQRSCLVTRILVRTTLSRYVNVPPERWRFRTNAYGRPEIESPVSSLRFNLSHTEGLVVCLVSRNREVGVDVEATSRAHRGLEVAERYFSPREAAALRATRPSAQPDRFLQFWTLKESYIKARGLGLAIPLAAFTFDLPAEESAAIRLQIEPTLGDDPGRWQFTLGRLGAGHLVATAVDGRGGPPVVIVRRPATELGQPGGATTL